MTHAIIKKSDEVNYIDDFIGIIDLPLVRMADVLNRPGPCFYLRHDVDHEIEMALAMAEVEARAGLTSTYFLLTPGSYQPDFNYYGRLDNGRIVHDAKLIDHCKKLIDLGHDIGFHNDLVSLSFRVHRQPQDLLQEEVDFFDKHSIKLVGTAAHGNPLARQLGYNNKELFEGCLRKDSEIGRILEYEGWKVRLHNLRLEDFGFAFEAYSLPRDSRLSESGSKWGGRIAGVRRDWPSFNANFQIEEFRKLMKTATADNGVKYFQVMTHPNHWMAV